MAVQEFRRHEVNRETRDDSHIGEGPVQVWKLEKLKAECDLAAWQRLRLKPADWGNQQKLKAEKKPQKDSADTTKSQGMKRGRKEEFVAQIHPFLWCSLPIK